MLGRLFLLFVVVTMTELYLLFTITDLTSPLFTLGLIITTGFIGAWLTRREGIRCIGRIRTELSRGQMPGDSLVDAMMIVVAGALLITPGILTDTFGFCLLIPPIRAVLKRWVIARFKHRIVVSRFSVHPQGGGDSEDVIDVNHRPVEPPHPG